MIVRFEETQDAGLVKGVVTHPSIFPHMFSDGLSPEEFTPFFEGVKWISALIDGRVAGLFLAHPQTSVCWWFHAMLLPHARGAIAIRLFREGLEWIRENTPCRKALGMIPAYNKPSIFVARKALMQVIGVNEKSIMKNGLLFDQIIFGMAL